MATATFKSNTYDGRYLQLTITSTPNAITNKSTLSWTLESIGGESTYYTIGKTTIVIAGETVYSKAQTDWDDRVFPAKKGSTSGSLTVDHGSDGKKTIEVSFKTRVYIFEPLEYGGNMVLDNIDRTAPTVTCATSNITSAGFKITGTSNVTADIWQYSLDDGSTWTQFSTTAGTTASITLTTLKPNTTYNVKVRARKKSNQVYGISSRKATKTLGASVIVKTYSFAADVASPVCKFNLTVYDAGYYHKLTIKKGTTAIFSVNLGKLTAGTADRTHSLTAAQRTALLNAFPNNASYSMNLVIGTYSDSGYSTLIGSESSAAVTVTTSAEVSKPEFTSFTYEDTKTAVVNVTGDNQVLVKNLSSLKVTCGDGTAKNGATIKSYSASIANASKTSTTTAISLGAITKYGDLTLTVTCTDSRGYATTLTATVKVLNYANPKLNRFTLRRKDEIEGLIQLSFGGTRSAIKADGSTDTNGLAYVRYRYKKTTEDTYSSYVSILADVTTSGTSFSFASLELLELDAESSYDFHLQIRDKFGSTTSLDVESVIPQGTPVVSLRKRNNTYAYPRVGINNPNPKHALDVAGSVAMNGFLVLGYVKDLTTENFNTLKEGIFFYPGSGCSNAPVDAPGFLEAITNGTAILHRFTTLAGAVYNRGYDGSSWTAWA